MPMKIKEIFQAKSEQVQNKSSKVSPLSVINKVRGTRLFTRAGVDKGRQNRQHTGWWMDLSPGPKNPVLFHKHLIGEGGKKSDHKRGSVFEAISVKRSSQDTSTESTSKSERETERRELYLVNNFRMGENWCNLFSHLDIKYATVTSLKI